MTPAQIIGYTLTYIGLAGFLLTMFRINKPIERHIEEKKKEVHPLFIDLYELDAEIDDLIKEEGYCLN